MHGDELIAHLYHEIPFERPFDGANYDYRVRLVYPWRTNQGLIRAYAREMGLPADAPVVFAMRLHAGRISCDGAFSLGANEALTPLDRWLSEASAVHLEHTVVRDCLHLLRRGPYDTTIFNAAAQELAQRDAALTYFPSDPVEDPPLTLTAERYADGCQCPKMLWMERFHPDMANPTNPTSPWYTPLPAEAQGMPDAARELAFALNAPPATANITFAYEGNTATVDLLREGPDGVHLTNLQEGRLQTERDLQRAAFQLWLLEASGTPVQTVSLMHLNELAVLDAMRDLRTLFHTVDVTKEVRTRAKEVPERLRELNSEAMTAPCEPHEAVGPHCLKPRRCPFKAWCWKRISQPNIYDIAHLDPYEARGLQRELIMSYPEVAEALRDGRIELKPRQVDQVLSWVRWRRPIVKPWDLDRFLNRVSYPLCILSVETEEPPFPPYTGLPVGCRVPVGYALRWQERPDGEWHERGFHVKPGPELVDDPRPAVMAQLLEDLPKDPRLVVYDWWATRTDLTALSGVKAPEALEALIEAEPLDLMAPFRQGAYYAAAMDGSAELERVLPALFPGDALPPDASVTERTRALGRILGELQRLAQDWVS